MGGFMIYEGGVPKRTLLPHELEDSKIEVPELTKEEIQDKSKVNILLKGLVILQIGWFIIQVIVRKAQGLSVTELETVTLAFAVLNFVAYGLWWQKPLDVNCPMRVYRKGSGKNAVVVMEDKGGGFWSVTRREAASLRDSVVELWKEYQWFTLIAPFLKMAGVEKSLDSSGKRVNTFYAGNLSRDEYAGVIATSFAIEAVFGAVHFLAWSYPFASRRERILWRVSAIAVTSFALYVVLTFVVGKLSENRPGRRWLKELRETLGSALVILLLIYIGCRVMLLVLPFISLRSLPSDAYRTVKWTTFIPHLH